MAAQFFLPLFNNLTQATCLVVGGGTTALRKIRWLVKAGATIKVVTPELCDELKEMEQAGKISVSMDVFRPVYVHKKLRFVISATNVSAVNRTVYEAALAAHVPVNCVDEPALCTFVFPAIVDRFPIVVAISSMGVAPTLSRVVRGWLEARLPAQLPALAELADSLRDRVKSNLPDVEQRKRFWETLFEGPAAELALQGKRVEAADVAAKALDKSVAHANTAGSVALVGAGPGDPELLTLKALRLLQSADVILYDKLVNPDILGYARRDAQMVYVGKQGPRPDSPPNRPDSRSNQQQDINQRLVDYAVDGAHVVRLKGGDPYIYGRGGEEVESALEAGLDVVVVPGVTAAMGAAATAQIPLTYRNLSQSVRYITGHRIENMINLDWPEMTRDDQTLVIYMGLTGLPAITEKLLSHGCKAERPVALIENATLPEERVLFSTVGRVAQAVVEQQVSGPSIVVIGDVVAHAPGWPATRSS